MSTHLFARVVRGGFVREQLHQPRERRQQPGPSVRAAHSRQCALADLKRVPQPLEQPRHVLLWLGGEPHVGVHLMLAKSNPAVVRGAQGTGFSACSVGGVIRKLYSG
jgi:hypothetical protein